MPRKKRSLDAKTSQQLYDFAVQQLGGPDVVLKEFFGDRVRRRLNSGATLGDLLDAAASEPGLETALRAMTLADITAPVTKRAAGRTTKKASTKKKATKTKATKKTATNKRTTKKKQKHARRLTAEQRQHLSDAICAILKETPWLQVGELRTALEGHKSYKALGRKLSPPQFDALVLGLRESKEIRSDDALGPKRLRYAHKSVKGPAPKP